MLHEAMDHWIKNDYLMEKLIKTNDITLRQRAEESLLASETRYRRLFESAKDGILILDAETGRIMDVNPFLIKLLGYSKEKIIEKEIWEIGFFKDIVANYDQFLELQQKEYVRYDDLSLETVDGRKINVEFVSNVYLVDKKKVIQCNIRDITKRKQSQQALRNSEIYLRTLVQTIPELIWLKDTNGVYLSCNLTFGHFFGAGEAEIVGKTDYDFVDRELANSFRANDRKAMEAGKPTINEEWVSYADDGHHAYLETIKTPMYDSNGILLGVLGIGRDITDRKNAEESLKKQKDEFETIFNLVPAQIWYKDTHNNFIRVNRQVCTDIGMINDKIEGYSAEELFPSFAQQYFKDDLEVINTRMSKLGITEQINTSKGEIRWVNTDKIPVFGNDGEISGLIAFVQDITERKLAVEALELSHREMENLLYSINDAAFSMDTVQSKMLIVSTAHEKIFGFPPSEFFKNPQLWYELIIPEDRPLIDAGYPILIAGKNLKHEVRIAHPNGQIRWIEARIRPTLDINEKLVRLDGIVSDITERKNTEEALLESEEKYRTFFENVQDVYYETTLDGIILEVSPSIGILSKGGYQREDLIGKSMYDFYSLPGGRQAISALIQECGSVTDYEIILKNRDGSTVPCSISAKIQFDANDCPLKIIGSMHDITERKLAEEILIENEAKYRTLVTQSPDGIFIVDLSGTFLSVNKTMCENLKYSEEEFLSMKIWDIVPLEYLSIHKKRLADIIKGERKNEVAGYEVNGKDGIVHSIEVLSAPYYKDKVVIGFQGIARDITERKKLELEKQLEFQTQEALNKILSLSVGNINLEESLERILMTIISLPFLIVEKKGGILLTDEGQNILTLKTSYNLSKEIQTKCAQVPFGHCLCGRAAATRQIQFVDCVDEGHEISYEGIKQHGHYNVPILTSDNVLGVIVVYLAENHKQEKYEQDFLLAVAVILSGLIQRKRAEKGLIAAKEKAEESDRLKSSFLANMSHEVRTPLNGIIGFSELLADPDFEEETKLEFVQHIIANGNNLLTIISDIMDISKMESGEITIRKALVNVRKFITTIQKQFACQAEAKNIDFELIIPKNDEDAVILADSERLQQIFNNLVGNAIKFTLKGSIKISYQLRDKFVEFQIKDTGIGIPAEYHDAIFNRFRQVEDANTRTYGGNGLGLAISKNLVELMGGKIWLESKPGKGSVFRFTLPSEDKSKSVL